MAWVKGNYRFKARDVDFDAIGQNFRNWVAGSGVQMDQHGGGLIMFSFASQLQGSGFLAVSAADMLSSTYGITMASNILIQNQNPGASIGSASTGFKIIPFAFFDVSGDGLSARIEYALSATQAMSADDSVAIIKVFAQTAGAQITLASNVNVHFQAFGWIISAPQALK